jgi:hypothetical protein
MDYTTQSVISYTVQIASEGTDFAAPLDLGTTTDLFATFQTADFNLKSLLIGAVPFEQTAIEVRIKSTSGTAGAQPIYSNSIVYLVTAYGCLNQYAVGAGIPAAGWNWNSPVNLFCDNNVLTATITFANDTFRIFTEAGIWDSGRNFPYYVNEGFIITSNFENAADGDQNFKFNATPGAYRFKIDENKKTITAFKSGVDSFWLVGAATPGGWSWAGNNETEFGAISDGLYEAKMIMTSGEAFRVFLGNNGGDSWDLGSYNYPYYASNGYTFDSELVNALDGDSNIRYTGPTELRTFKINTNTKVITVD